jgi:tetratricopeptide (TPR) repeat protein
MPRRTWIAVLSFWPGLPQIWAGQEVLGLLLAGLFGAGVNLAILTRWVWTELAAPGVPDFLAVLAGLLWAASLGYTLWWLWQCHPERHRPDIDRLYREAQEAYLQGRWSEARKRFEEVLTLDETDADALMQLGSLFVRTGQPALARRAFRQCLELEGGAKWQWEVRQALARLDRPSAPVANEPTHAQ